MTLNRPTVVPVQVEPLSRAVIATWQQQLHVADAGPCATSFAELEPVPVRNVQLTELMQVCGGDDPWPSGTCFPDLDAVA